MYLHLTSFLIIFYVYRMKNLTLHEVVTEVKDEEEAGEEIESDIAPVHPTTPSVLPHKLVITIAAFPTP